MKKWFKVFLMYIAVQLMFLLLHLITAIPLFNSFSLEHMIVSDFSLNDLHYKLSERLNSADNNLSGDIVLLNSGDIETDSFRYDLARVLARLKTTEVKLVILDHEFSKSNNSEPRGTEWLLNELLADSRFVVCRGQSNDLVTDDLGKPYANANFPVDQFTIRKYYSDSATIAYHAAKAIAKVPLKPLKGSFFYINYVAAKDDVMSLDSEDFLFSQLDTSQPICKFLKLDAAQVLTADSLAMIELANVLKYKVVIIGHLGNTSFRNIDFDSEDKHAVPCDTTAFFNRQNSMHGTLIHAIAAENILNPELRYSCWSDSFLCHLLEQLFVFFYILYLLYYNLGKIWNFIILALLSFPYMYIVLYLMEFNIYLEMGLTLVALLVVEEGVEVVESLEHTIMKLWKKRLHS